MSRVINPISHFELVVPARIIIRRSVGHAFILYASILMSSLLLREVERSLGSLSHPRFTYVPRSLSTTDNLLSHLSRRDHSQSLVISRPVPHATITSQATSRSSIWLARDREVKSSSITTSIMTDDRCKTDSS